jgi:YebC/PmpR family DNA-binding regulatory protein
MGRAFEYRKAAKQKRWGAMSRIFPKLAKAVMMAAKEGGADPDMNPKLRAAIQNAKAQNMPKKNIDAAIDRATGKDAKDFTLVNYEGKGPHGVLCFIECATDNTTRTVANIKSYFNKADGSLVPNGSLTYMFNRKAVFELLKTDEMDLEEMELELIDAGLDEIEENDGTVYIYSEYTDFGTLGTAIEALGFKINSSNLKRFPTTPVVFTEEQLVDIDKMMDKFDEDDDVQAIYTNID